MVRQGRKSGGMIWFLIFLILALYFVNMSLGFIQMPKFMLKIERWLILVGGILLFFAGFNFLKVRRHRL
jgi:cytochrome c biogenesis protein CcdA